jgi:hypothetical protein
MKKNKKDTDSSKTKQQVPKSRLITKYASKGYYIEFINLKFLDYLNSLDVFTVQTVQYTVLSKMTFFINIHAVCP